MARSELAQRLAVAAVGVPLAVAVIFAGGWVMGAVLAVIAIGGAAEFYRLAGRQGVAPLGVLGGAAAAAYVLGAIVLASSGRLAAFYWVFTVLLVLLAAGATIWARGVEGRPLPVAAITVFGALYTGATLAHGLLIRHMVAPELWQAQPAPPASVAVVGTALVAYAIGLTWMNDSAAYFAGRAWGRRKLIPRVSPGKTVEGATAGVVVSVLVGALYTAFVLDGWLGLGIGPLAGAIGGALVSVTAQVGDLVESLFKREAGVKDSGHLLPGHGGILDRFDALLFTLPVAFHYLAFVLPMPVAAF